MEFKLNHRDIDIRAYLDSRNIPYTESGKNISQGWIGIQCPFCQEMYLEGDPSNHLGISLQGNSISCWKCGTKGTVLKLIMKLEKCSLRKIPSLVKDFLFRGNQISTEDYQEEEPINTLDFPNFFEEKLLPQHREYLEGRNFDADFVFKKYKLRCVERYTQWKFRLIIPVYMKRRLVTWLGRDITGKSKLRYKNLRADESIVPVKKTLYNLDTVKQTAIVVEGPTDVWRVGDGSVATFGTQVTPAQISQLSMNIHRVFVMFDPEAKQEGINLAHQLSVYVPEVQVVTLDSCDPADLKDEEIKSLRKDIFGKIF